MMRSHQIPVNSDIMFCGGHNYIIPHHFPVDMFLAFQQLWWCQGEDGSLTAVKKK